MSSETHLVFVYGTLRRGASNAFRMEAAEFVRTGVVRGRLYVIDWYPGFVQGGNSGWVEGELWRVSPTQLQLLDEFEGDEYQRVRIEVLSLLGGTRVNEGEGEEESAWIWEWNKPVDGLQRVDSGDWLDVENPRPKKLYTSLGCLSLIALPLGGAVIAEFIGKAIGWNATVAGAFIVLILASAPLLALLLLRWADRRREGGQEFRDLITGISLIWLTAMGFGLPIWIIIQFVNW